MPTELINILTAILGRLLLIGVFFGVSPWPNSVHAKPSRWSNMFSQLATVRSQLEVYKVQHNGDYPAADLDNGNGEWTALTEETEIDGTPSDRNGSGLGPYLNRPPINPFQDSSTIALAAAEDVGWVYTAAAGQIMAVMPASKAAAGRRDTTADVLTWDDSDRGPDSRFGSEVIGIPLWGIVRIVFFFLVHTIPVLLIIKVFDRAGPHRRTRRDGGRC